MTCKLLSLAVSVTNFCWSCGVPVEVPVLSLEESCLKVDLNGVLWKDDGASIRIFEFLRESIPSDTKVVELFYRDLNVGVDKRYWAQVKQVNRVTAELQSNGDEGKCLRDFYQSYLNMIEHLEFE